MGRHELIDPRRLEDLSTYVPNKLILRSAASLRWSSEKLAHFGSAVGCTGVSWHSESLQNQPQCALVLIQSCRLMTLLRFRANDQRGYVTAAVGRIIPTRLIKDNDQ